MFRVIACSAVLVFGLSWAAVAAPACDDDGCQARTASKPLDITKFMKEQAANTRAANPVKSKGHPVAQAKHKTQPVAHVQRPARRLAVAARPKPAGLPVEAAASYAAQEPAVKIVDSDEFNDIDRAAEASPAPAETTGSAASAEPNVQLVDNSQFNNIDRKAEDRLPLSARARIAEAQRAGAQQASVSWTQWIWSGLANVFIALATAVHQLVGL